jgi:hypothetical protein
MKTGDIRKEFFAEPYPVTTTVQVARLYDPDFWIEITAIAEIPRERFGRLRELEPVMKAHHVPPGPSTFGWPGRCRRGRSPETAAAQQLRAAMRA